MRTLNVLISDDAHKKLKEYAQKYKLIQDMAIDQILNKLKV